MCKKKITFHAPMKDVSRLDAFLPNGWRQKLLKAVLIRLSEFIESSGSKDLILWLIIKGEFDIVARIPDDSEEAAIRILGEEEL